MELSEKIFNISSEEEFSVLTLDVFRRQYQQCSVYRKYAKCFCPDPGKVKHLFEIPFLPVEFFKTEKIINDNASSQQVFKSSGTGRSGESKHYVADLAIYERSAIINLEMLYGPIKEYTVLALLPGYLQQKKSSLVWMANLFMSKSNFRNDNGFFLDEHNQLIEKLEKLVKLPERKILLLGVSYALLDIAEKINFPLNDVIVMETGGMKGKRKEVVREELHHILCEKLGVSKIHSEYGMTEMLSQAYSQGHGIFKCPPWMKVMVREMNDPLSYAACERTGGINVIDLANINSCSFIATQDLGKAYEDGTFEILGRIDSSDARGCNLLIDN